ncbi:hypothetical protein GUY44_24185 [Pimelobacter simplex]|nr:hypothetical protein [Pimelobacter simplex]MCG8153598.1 hypothetical protein [Pimelobacter simplex]GEB17064.1 hypothetical protein NSI01_53790 [Pimelobacter simplex]SFN07647.1 hypothetical protein SAMN05421671_4955 [Pimelobacter simplex]
MKINVPFRVRVALYLANVLGTPVVVYLRAKGIIGDLELTLWGAEVAAAFAVAGLNAGTSPDGQWEAFVKRLDERDRRASLLAERANRKAGPRRT